MKRVLTVEELRKTKGLRFDEVPVPEMGPDCVVRIGSLTAGQRVEFAEFTDEQRKKAPAWLFKVSIVDEAGNRIGTDELYEELMGFDAALVQRVVDAVFDLNGMRDKKETVKNDSGEAASVASPTA